MALVKAAGRPISAAVTVEGGTEVVVTDVREITILDGVELIEDMSGNSQRPYYWQGGLKEGFSFLSADLDLYKAVTKSGVYIGTATVLIEGVRTADGTKQGSADVVKRVVTDGVCVRGEMKVDTSGKPSPVQYIITAAHGEDGVEGTVTDTVTTT